MGFLADRSTLIHSRKEVKGNEEVGEYFLGIGDFISFVLWVFDD